MVEAKSKRILICVVLFFIISQAISFSSLNVVGTYSIASGDVWDYSDKLSFRYDYSDKYAFSEKDLLLPQKPHRYVFAVMYGEGRGYWRTNLAKYINVWENGVRYFSLDGPTTIHGPKSFSVRVLSFDKEKVEFEVRIR